MKKIDELELSEHLEREEWFLNRATRTLRPPSQHIPDSYAPGPSLFLPQVRSPMPALTAAGPSPTAQTSEPTCRHTLTPRDTSVRAAPRPSPACHSWQGMKNLAAAPVLERYGFGAGRRDKTSTQKTTAGVPLGSLLLVGALRGARSPGGWELTALLTPLALLSGGLPCLPQPVSIQNQSGPVGCQGDELVQISHRTLPT